MKVKISAKSLLQEFHSCDDEFVKNVCHGACCESHSGGRKTLITINPDEEEMIKDKGGIVVEGLLQAGDKCPFKTLDNRCAINETKPFGCKASPFILTSKDTLIVRNRYRMLRCFRVKEDKVPAYKAFRASLDMLFGEEEAQRIVTHIETNKTDMEAKMPNGNYKKLKENDQIKKAYIGKAS